MQVNMLEAKNRLSSLIAAVERGEELLGSPGISPPVSEYSPHPTRLSLGARSRVFHEDTEEREEILSQRHKDTKIEKPFMASYLSFLLRVFVSL